MSKLRTNLSLRQNYRLTSASEAIWAQMRPEAENYPIEQFLARKFKWDNLGDFQPPCEYIIVKKVRSVIWFPFLYIMLFFLTHFDAFWQMYSVRVVSSLSQLQLLYPGIPIHQIDQAYHAWCWLRHFFTVFENIYFHLNNNLLQNLYNILISSLASNHQSSPSCIIYYIQINVRMIQKQFDNIFLSIASMHA